MDKSEAPVKTTKKQLEAQEAGVKRKMKAMKVKASKSSSDIDNAIKESEEAVAALKKVKRKKK